MASPFLVVGAVIAWFAFPNIGLPFGYYGELNRALAALRATPGVVVTRYGANYDSHLEEISVDLRLSNGWVVDVFVPDHTDFAKPLCVVIQSLDGTDLGSVGHYPASSGLTFSLGPGGDLEPILGKTLTSVPDVIESIDAIAAFIASRPIEELRALYEPAFTPPGAVMLKIERIP